MNALITLTGTSIIHDETAGLQDDDVLFPAIPLAFSSRLADLGASTAIGAAGSNGNVVNFGATGTLGNISLSGADGKPLAGLDSGLQTTSGDAIYLWTDGVDDNIVFGKTQGGVIVFAVYLQPTGGMPPTGAKLWTVQYQAIQHPDAADPDDAVDLSNLVHVTANAAQNFSFANAPSGQNLFMMFGTSSQAILVTGENPANQSAGANVSSGSTVNSSQGGGTTTLGTNNQRIDAKEALVLTFVTGANPDYLAGPGAGNNPGQPLSSTEANVEANIQFTATLLVRAAEFTISQMQPNNATATVRVEAYFTADAPGVNYVDGNPLVSGDIAINISGVQVIRGGSNVVGTQGVSVDLSGTSAVITGVLTGDIIRYATDADHNRVLIRNDQPAQGSGSNIGFDLGGFALTEAASSTMEIGSKIIFHDDGPSIMLGTRPEALTVDETNLSEDASGSFAGLFSASFGADGAASGGGLSYVLSIGVEDADSGLTDTATGNPVFLFLSADGKTVTGRAGTDKAAAEDGAVVFVISVDADGKVTLDQQRAIAHPDATDPDEALTLADEAISITAIATDGDGDRVEKSVNVGDRFTFRDDAPEAGANSAVQFDDETAQTTNAAANPGGADDVAGTSATATGTLAHGFGADEAGTVLLQLATLPVTGGFSQELSPDAATLTISQMQNGAPVAVLKVEVTPTTGAYTMTHLAPVFHPTPGSSEENVTFTINYRVTDGDGDWAESSVSVHVNDDTPAIETGTEPQSLTASDAALNAKASASFATLFDVSYGADGPAATDALTYALSIGVASANSGVLDTATGNPVFLFMSSDGTTITGKAGTSLASAASGPTVFEISINASTGVVELEQMRAIMHPNANDPSDTVTLADVVISVTATAKDGDGDTATHTVSVGDYFSFADDNPMVTVGNASGTYMTGAKGSWTPDAGNDGLKSLNVALNSFEISQFGTVIATGDNSSLVRTGDRSFDGWITGDFNGDGQPDKVEFTLTFDPDDPESYSLVVTTPPSGITLKDSSQGTLKASGPNPVRTLMFGGSESGADDVVFFGVVATASASGIMGNTPPNDLLDLVVPGATDLSEAQIRSFLTPTNQIPTLISASTQMNVSTAGIGINNNNLDGSRAGIQAGDESFVFNPEEVVDNVRVFISNSVGGYNTATEELYFRVFHTDGTVTDHVLVTANMVKPALRGDPTVPKAAQGGSYFDIDVGDKRIDAVQLTMGLGTVKIPVIQWSIEETLNPEPLRLDFTATLFDGDDDFATDTFSIDLAADGMMT
ncbi:DUF5801 repeats-in-toxin domain-containing protein [Tabrizicola sp. YIM 78059]|uniref:DUF5801 repeats-in-toxin domain-containing protein n=1 Tax=Tabrizicola sp. YIM 78059 TaxID=2529861 RepID=UPI0010AA3805|nr:DUF5801 repeats-in-toxin domain-containing protein [Tabrizicola sp. YIM 78059]